MSLDKNKVFETQASNMMEEIFPHYYQVTPGEFNWGLEIDAAVKCDDTWVLTTRVERSTDSHKLETKGDTAGECIQRMIEVVQAITSNH